MLTSNDGQQYQDWMDYYAKQRTAEADVLQFPSQESKTGISPDVLGAFNRHAPGGYAPPANAGSVGEGVMKGKIKILHPERSELNIDYDHHVPLLASATMDDSGNMTGIAIDSRQKGKFSPEEEALLHHHEDTELRTMNKLVGLGVPASIAYGESHPIATAAETAVSKALWGDEGHEKYKEKMRLAAAESTEPSDLPVHDRAHTSIFGLDRSELGTAEGAKYAGLMDYLFGSDTAQAKGHPANYPMTMPTYGEAEFARKGELSYGSPHAAFEEGERGRFIKPGVLESAFNKAVDEGFKPDTFSFLKKVPTLDIPPQYKEMVSDIYTKAKLVANRSPITALGFDPRHAAVEEKQNLVGTVGLFTKDQDQAWASLANEDVLAHELTHRGINELKKAGRLTPEETKWLEANNNWYDERVVRYLMDKYAHQDESANPAQEAMTKEARSLFEDIPKNMKMLESIEKKAQDLYHEKYGQMHHAEDDQKPFKVAEEREYGGIRKSDIGDPFTTPTPGEHKPLQVDPMAEAGVHTGPGYAPMLKLPSGKEISLARSLKEVAPERREEVLNRIFQRQFPGTRSIGAQKKEFEEAKKRFTQ